MSLQAYEAVQIKLQTAQRAAAFAKQQVLLLKKKATLDLASFKQAVQEVQSVAQRLTYLLDKTERKAQEQFDAMSSQVSDMQRAVKYLLN